LKSAVWQASVAVVVVVMSYSAARAAPLIEKRSGASYSRSGCRGDVVLSDPCSTADWGSLWGRQSVAVVVVVMSYSTAHAAPLLEERSGAGKRRSGCRSGVVLGGPCSTAD